MEETFSNTSDVKLWLSELAKPNSEYRGADLIDNILVVEGSIHSEFHSWNKGREECCPKDFLDFLSN